MAKVLVNSAAIRKKDLVVVDGDLNVVEDAKISVIDYELGSYALIYDKDDKETLISNPFTADDTGQFAFYVEEGIYKINAVTQTDSFDLEGSVIVDLRFGAGGAGNWLQRDYDVKPLTNAANLPSTDHTDQIEQWLSKGGRCDVEAGVYIIKRPIIAKGITTVVGQSAGVGTGGFDPDSGATTDYLELLIKEAEEGSSIFYVDPAGTWSVGIDTHALTFEEIRFRNLPAVSLNEFKMASDLNAPAPVGAIKISGAYDNNSMKNVNCLFFGDQPVIEVTKGEFEGTLGQSINWVGVNAIGAISTTRTAPAIKLNWIQEGTITSCKAFGTPFNNGNYSLNDCWLIDNSRGLVFDGCSAALTRGNGFNFIATERGCIFHDLVGCTFERLGEESDDYAAIKAEKSDVHAVGRITIQAPRIEVPVDRFLLTVGEVNSVRGNTIFGNCILGSGTSGCELDVDSLASVTDNSGNNSNLLRQRPNLNTSYLGHNKDIATVGSALSLRFITDTSDLNDFYRISWSASDINDFGLFSQNSRAGKSWQHLPDGKLRVNDGTDFTATTNYCDIDPTNGFTYNRTISPSYRWNAGDSFEHNYRAVFSASTAGGISSFTWTFDSVTGAPSVIHEPNGDLTLSIVGGETGLNIKTATGANKRITANDAGELLLNGVPVGGSGSVDYSCLAQSTSGVIISTAFTNITFDATPVYDDSSGQYFNPANADRITIPAGIERVDLSAYIEYPSNAVDVNSYLESNVIQRDSAGNRKEIVAGTVAANPGVNNPRFSIGMQGIPVASGDYFELRVRGTPFQAGAPQPYSVARMLVKRVK